MFLPLALIASSTAVAQPADGFEWRTIGAPGNRATIPTEVPWWPELQAGSVDHEYRLMRTEVTTGQYFEFLTAYSQFHPGLFPVISVTGMWISSDGNGGFRMAPGAEYWPASASWRMGARMANWLHNGKVNEAWAFETGAYDTSTFTQNPDGTYNDAPHLPGARYWIPSADELIKGLYFDPHRYGQGQGGYWLYPNGTDEPLIPGLPQDGGQTNAWSGDPPPGVLGMDVGSYQLMQSPWGLLDGSGGEREWAESGSTSTDRWQFGSRIAGIGMIQDRLDYRSGQNPNSGWGGFRLASPVPAPCTLFALIALLPTCRRTTR